jgi:hypothetical protein
MRFLLITVNFGGGFFPDVFIAKLRDEMPHRSFQGFNDGHRVPDLRSLGTGVIATALTQLV